MYNPFTLEGKTILVTGASSGIGASTAIQCSKMGAILLITGRNKERLQSVYDQLAGTGHEQYLADLALETEIDQLIAKIPAVDGIVHSAGIILGTKLIRFLNQSDISKLFSINFFAPVLLAQKMLAKRKLKKAASVVFIASLAAFRSDSGNALYGAAKSALNSFAKYLAKEVVASKIRVNSICPAMVKTPLIHQLDIISDEERARDEKRYPLGYGKPEDIAHLAMYLLSDASSWMTGNSIPIDGGILL